MGNRCNEGWSDDFDGSDLWNHPLSFPVELSSIAHLERKYVEPFDDDKAHEGNAFFALSKTVVTSPTGLFLYCAKQR